MEPSKVCAGPCGKRRPWGDFYAKVKWPDGTTRQPHSRCKRCHNRARAEHARAKPELARERRRRAWVKVARRLRVDPEFASDYREGKRFTAADFRRREGRAVHGSRESSPLVPAAPFGAWLAYVMQRDGTSLADVAKAWDVPERTLRRAKNGEQKSVKLTTVEAALVRDNTRSLRDLYPAVYESG